MHCLQIHANICMRAVVVTETLDWRLHGLDLMTEHMATGDLPLMSASWMVGAQYKPSEIAKCEWSVIQQGPPWAVDSWGLGCLMQVSYYAVMCKLALEHIRNTQRIPTMLQTLHAIFASLTYGKKIHTHSVGCTVCFLASTLPLHIMTSHHGSNLCWRCTLAVVTIKQRRLWTCLRIAVQCIRHLGFGIQCWQCDLTGRASCTICFSQPVCMLAGSFQR